jgi:quinol-cytochrome oxidoreductase complex cytochrome b subunit
VVILLALIVGLTGIKLAQDYRPTAPGVERSLLSDDVGQAQTIRRLHEASLFLLILASLGAAITTILARRRAGVTDRRRWVAAVGAIGMVLAAVAASYTWELVQWGQLALWAVTVDPGIDGLWFAAFNDQVQFVLIDGLEVSQTTYAVWTIAHLALPLAVIAGAGAACTPVLRRTPTNIDVAPGH